MINYRPAWAEIDLDAVRQNFSAVKNSIAPDTKILAVVKANAYGHGAEKVSNALCACGVDYLGVASLDEAILLKEKGIKKQILILTPVLPGQIKDSLKFDFTQTVCSDDFAKELDKNARSKNKIARTHIKIDTGMGRLGIWHKNALALIEKIKGCRNIGLEGIFSHLSSADDNSEYTNRQISYFKNLIERLKKKKIDIPYRHLANSAGLVGFKDSHFNMVRPGLMIYGIYPHRIFRQKITLMPAMGLKTKIVYLKDTPKGRAISYGRTHITKAPSKIATVPVGYGDGYQRGLSNKAEVLVRGKRAPVIGTICMDHFMIDVTGIEGVRQGDEVVLFGRQGRGEISAEEVASWAGTIPYEIVTCITQRVPRVYI